MKTTRHLPYSLMLAALCCVSAQAADLDLSDCDVLIGKKHNAAYKGWARDNQKSAEAGDREAIRLRAIEASNRLACHQEVITGDDDWGMIVSSADGTSETHLPPGIPNIRKHPAAWRALNQAAKYGHQAGAFGVGHKGAAAELVLRYAADLPQYLEGAYEDAAAVYEYDCVLKRKFERRDRAAGCASARTARARLIPLVAAERRRALDASARRWAEGLPTASK
ncbi:hypothetical protein ACFFTM_13965 [Pseudoduganella plicata]|uniref:Lysozyme inhibitor LprI N-terminal domain-containing protein n=1 Tax=Pseudoduganella plicata TaxID=321984 RepID=A0A4P7BDF3_9BURK|nr:hypothetical protein [Pseudoduganella plicata]QBQ35525.1 hypothetical protein E1742_04615 [Pseudoduganella plicata]GGY97168.1 hypothetical protein GCM10007388_33560 [Pseudoduganella plicata]